MRQNDGKETGLPWFILQRNSTTTFLIFCKKALSCYFEFAHLSNYKKDQLTCQMHREQPWELRNVLKCGRRAFSRD